jgi:hypothetical protein
MDDGLACGTGLGAASFQRHPAAVPVISCTAADQDEEKEAFRGYLYPSITPSKMRRTYSSTLFHLTSLNRE